MRVARPQLWLIDEEFRQNPRITGCSSRSCARPSGVTHELRRMNLYGVLGRYIPPSAASSVACIRPVPRLHGRCAHPVRRAQPAPA
jgi:hypothetical protein